jgi:hypothetical protein
MCKFAQLYACHELFNYNFKHLDIGEQFIWLMSNEDNFIINQLSDMILKLHSSRNDIIQN